MFSSEQFASEQFQPEQFFRNLARGFLTFTLGIFEAMTSSFFITGALTSMVSIKEAITGDFSGN
jgi:hypothetical protein